MNKTIKNSKVGKGTIIWRYVNIFDSEIGKGCHIGAFVEIARAKIGNLCRIGSGAFICANVTIEDEVFIGPNVTFTDDKYPKAPFGNPYTRYKTLVKKGASIGANATIICGVTIGKNVVIGAGSVVTKNVPDGETWVGNPAHHLEKKNKC